MKHWLFKSEPETFGIDALARRPDQTEHWDGVRNYQARNMLQNKIKKGDQAFFYHSGCTPPGIVGIIEVVQEGYPDFTAFDPKCDHYDPDSSPDNPRWYMVDVKLIKKWDRMITLDELKSHPDLENMQVTRRGNRLSITAVTDNEWKTILKLGSA